MSAISRKDETLIILGGPLGEACSERYKTIDECIESSRRVQCICLGASRASNSIWELKGDALALGGLLGCWRAKAHLVFFLQLCCGCVVSQSRVIVGIPRDTGNA